MSDSGKKWIVKDAKGRMDGPFTTEKILYKIGRGEFTGEEQIAFYPGGNWIPITQDGQFYDKLLESLSEQMGPNPTERTEVMEFTRPDQTAHGAEPAESPGKKEPRTPDIDMENGPRPSYTESPTDGSAKKTSPRRKKTPDVIELVDSRGVFAKEILKRSFKPLIVAVVGIVLIVWLFTPASSNEGRIHLLAPQKNVAQVAASSLKSRTDSGVGQFVRDTFEGYISAENDFVQVVEKNHKSSQVMALLCMTYLQLWPYAYQDSSDFKTIAALVQMSTSVDPGGVQSSTCRAVDLIVRGRYQEAKNLTEAMLEQRANAAAPPILFYYLKGLLLDGMGDQSAAIGYLESAQRLWPQWTLPYVLEAQVQMKKERYSKAANLFQRILQANPRHTVSKIELGILNYKYFNKYKKGQELLESALRGSAKAPKGILSRGYFGLAEIQLKQGNQKKALLYAQKSYSLNSAYSAAKNLIVRLGGIEKLRSTKVKGQQLIYEGDQYFREGDCQAAQAYYKAAFDQEKNAMAAMKAAQCLWTLSFSTEAIEWLNKAIHADPKMIESYVLMADYYTQRYNFLAASRTLANAYKVNPKSPDVFRGFALVELRRGNAKGAITYAKKALDLYENDVETLILLAKAYLAARDYRMAYNYAAKAIEFDVNNRKAQTVYSQALVGLQGIDVGVDYLLKLVNSYPLVMDYRIALGKIYEKDERWDQAEQVFRQITKIQEKPKEAYIQLAHVLRATGRLPDALEYLFKAAVLDPADADPLYQAGIIYLDTHKPKEALDQFQRVLQINPLYPRVHFQMGRAALELHDPHRAIEETRQEKAANPNLADAYLLAAGAYTDMKQYSLCASEYQKAIKLRPQTAMIYVKLAQCYRKSGNLDAAVAMLNQAASQESGLADIYKEQGAIYEIRGDIQQAIEAYNQYFVLDPNAPDRPQIERRILTLQRGGSL